MSKKFSIILATFLTIIVGIWIWSFAMPKNYVILGGSTSVNPFMQLYTKEYEAHNHKDFIYNSTGSQAGVSGVEKHMYGAGFISKDATASATLSPGNSFFDFGDVQHYETGHGTEFKETIQNAKTGNSVSANQSFIAFEFAIDAIIIVYSPPTWFLDEGLDKKLDFLLNKNDPNSTDLGKIYANSLTWEDLAKSLGGTQRSSKTSFNTFTREDGSGTRSAFSDLTKIKNMETANVVNSNGAMLDNVKKSPGSIGFVSYAFIDQVDGNSNVRIAGINGIRLGNLADGTQGIGMVLDETTGTFIVNANNTSNEEYIKSNVYSFQRPFITIFSLKNKQISLIVDFFAELIGIGEQEEWVKETFIEEGLVPKFEIKSFADTTRNSGG
ncbi:phosphate ABC transporter substrate-binding protein [Spiroplasma clarkii]|uniref:Phosphate ABC transporter substrate-binding protein n=1 Tax=Spiroplasma clarkii TaxID=2139 RepID=A0A1Y0KZV0_9MOLU|nr:phosphate ABC transporter substrate-binding protein [Spiroplasma clarkii]ARU91251.1 phosphate ABC transporter substrate-binding protein [Spiroplasma clarkii]ATX70686.1 phosphate ABC transporter substrate-binding protein [Spiroplasma clarkii]